MRSQWLYILALLLCPLAAQSQSAWEDVTPSASFVEPTFEEISAGGDGHLVARNGDVLYASHDGGDTWDELPAFTLFEVERVDYAVIDRDGTVYAFYKQRGFTANWAVYRLSLGEDIWIWANDGLPEWYLRTLAVHPITGTLLAGPANSTLYRSTDRGTTWQQVTEGLNNPAVVHHVDFSSEGIIYIDQKPWIYRSEDDGATWERDGPAIPTFRLNRVVISDDGTLYASDNSDIYARPDGATSWHVLDVPRDDSSPGTGTLATAGSTLLVYDGAGLFRLDPDGTWSRPADGLPSDDITALTADLTGTFYFSVRSGGAYRSSEANPDVELLTVDLIEPDFPALVTSDAGLLFASAGRGGLFRSEDGTTWTLLPYDAEVNGPISQLVSATDVLLAATPAGVLRSTDRGETWESVVGLPDRLPYHMAGSDVLFASFPFVGVDDPRGLFRSVDAGATWDQVPEGVYALHFAVGWDGTVISELSNNGTLFRSTDGGLTWVPSSSGIDCEEITYVFGLIERGRTGEFFASFDSSSDCLEGFRSTDNGATWTSWGSPNYLLLATPDLLFHVGPPTPDGDFEVYRTGENVSGPISSGGVPSYPLAATLDTEGRFYAGLARGLYRTTGNATPNESGASAPASLTLDAPYPNPTRGPVTLAFTLGTTERVSLTVYDVLGRTVAQPLNANRSAARHTVTWDATALPSGTYVAELRTASGVQRRPFTLLR